MPSPMRGNTLLAISLVVLAMSWTSQPARAGLFTDSEAQKKILDLQQQNQQLQQKISALEERVAKLDTVLRSQGLVDLLQSVEAMKNDIATLRGQLEVNTNGVETTQKRQKDLYVDLDSRVRKLERVETAPPAPGQNPIGTGPAGGPTSGASNDAVPNPNAAPSVPADPAAESRSYDSAFNLFKIGNYPASIAGFQSFLRAYPSSPLAANAQYWIGNAYSALRDCKTALSQQQRLISTYPTSPKVPDAMLNMASCQVELGDKATARRTLDEIIGRYPLSPAADSAKKRLNTLH